jgi:hypothetical protein
MSGVGRNKRNEFLAYVIFLYDPDTEVSVGQMWPQTCRNPKFVSGFFGLDSVILIDEIILDLCYEIWE